MTVVVPKTGDVLFLEHLVFVLHKFGIMFEFSIFRTSGSATQNLTRDSNFPPSIYLTPIKKGYNIFIDYKL